MDWLVELSEYWKRQYPERDFARVSPLVRLSRLAERIPEFQKEVLKPHGLTPSDYSILGALRRAGRPRQLMPSDLYSALGCTPGGLTKMIDRLERQGLVERVADREDGRRAKIRLTRRGETLGGKAFDDYNDAGERLLGRLSESDLESVDAALALLLECFEDRQEGAREGAREGESRERSSTARRRRAATPERDEALELM